MSNEDDLVILLHQSSHQDAGILRKVPNEGAVVRRTKESREEH
jgi:hypothetical protein